MSCSPQLGRIEHALPSGADATDAVHEPHTTGNTNADPQSEAEELPEQSEPPPQPMPQKKQEPSYENIELRLAPLARELPAPKPGDWLFEHKESGQTFAEYIRSEPVRRSPKWNTIHICVVGDISEEQQRIIETTREYMELFFDAPVKMGKQIPVSEIPEHAQRKHPEWGGDQILTTYILNEVLRPNRPENALASLAFTATDLWPGKGWNFVFGQASLRDRTGVWSIQRNGDPGESDASYRLCLQRTLGTASHETAHILSMPHCKKFECSLNGSNHLKEADRKPLHLCPICLRKLCWNLQVDPVKHLSKLEVFCRKHGFTDDAEWYRQAIHALSTGIG
jgi:archaemetzincin